MMFTCYPENRNEIADTKILGVLSHSYIPTDESALGPKMVLIVGKIAQITKIEDITAKL